MTEFRNKIEIRMPCAIAAMRGDTFKSRSGHQELLTRKSRKSSSRSRRLYNSVLVSIQIKNLLKPENTETKKLIAMLHFYSATGTSALAPD